MSRFRHHVFVCTNTRPEGGRPACGGSEIFAALQQNLARHPDLWSEIAVTATGCLGPCFDGPMMVVYPEGVWYARVQAADAREVVEQHLLAGNPVERLRHRWPE